MKKLLNPAFLKLVMNMLILLILITGALTILGKAHRLFFHPDEIKIIKLDVPWNQPLSSVTLMFDQNILQNDTKLIQELQIKIFSYDLFNRIIFVSLILIILFQIKKLVLAIRAQSFLEPKNIKIVNRLSVLVGIWVLSTFIFYEIIPYFFPLDLITERINFTTLSESITANILSAIDFKMLLVAITLYVISVLFKEGYALKEEADLTI